MGGFAAAVAKLSPAARASVVGARYVPTVRFGSRTWPWPRVDGIPTLCPFGVALCADGLLVIEWGVERPDIVAVARGEWSVPVVVPPAVHTDSGLVTAALGLGDAEQDAVSWFMNAWDAGKIAPADLARLFGLEGAG